MNLLTDPWIPVQRKKGTIEYIAPWQITEPDNPVIRLASPRHDFDGSLIQFLIGLLQTAAAPANGSAWEKWLTTPPSPEVLKERFSAYHTAFEVNGDGPRFMQDYEVLEGEEKPISGLMIEAPGNRTSTLFLDHFIKDGVYGGLCPCCAVTALFALQTNAPGGGVGHRTSLRGGGPLTTLVIPDTQVEGALPDTLWSLLWLNVLDQKDMRSITGDVERVENRDIFPWMSETRTSEAKTGRPTTPLDASPLQMFWAMPRRIRLNWANNESGTCDLCGAEGQPLVTHYVTKNYGVNYIGGWLHPLSPYYQDKKSAENLPMHAQPGGLAYRYWLAWTQGDDRYLTAKVVRTYKTDRQLIDEQLRLWVFGYDMDNMKARCWYEKQYPLVVIEDEKLREAFCTRVANMVDLSTQVSGFVQSCVKEAWFNRPKDARGDTGFIKEAFFEQTEADFLSHLQQLQRPTDDSRWVLQEWHAQLARHAIKLFDHWVAQGDLASENPRRIAEAHRKLRNLIYGKKLLSNLGIELKKKEKAV